jgi:D-arabinose 1-dehydrogenase-like Zn-dependent alcohol dehydrogenase
MNRYSGWGDRPHRRRVGWRRHRRVQIAVAVGARVYAVSSVPNHEFVKGLGAVEVFDYNRPNWSEAVRDAVPGSVDVLFDAVGDLIVPEPYCGPRPRDDGSRLRS